MNALGLPCVSSIGGAMAAGKADWTPLQGFRRVVVMPDNDLPGEAYARDVVAALGRLPGQREVLLCRLPGLPPSGDAVDWIQERVPAWEGFGPIPREAGDDLDSEFREVIESHLVPPEWAVHAVATVETWEPPVPLDAAQRPAWPRDVFPSAVQAFVDAVADALETPPEMPAMATLAVLATAAQGRYSVAPEPGYFEPLCLWTLCAMPSGSRKTAVLKHVTEPLTDWEVAKRAEVEPLRARAESERKTLEGRIDALRKKAAKAASQEVVGIMQEIEVLERDMPAIPALPQLWTGDVTAEHLAVLMAANNGCMALLSDEAGIFSIIGGRYSAGVPNLDIYLQGHAGSPVRVNRGSRDPVFLLHPCLTIGLLPQPDVLASLQDKPEFRGRGLLGRFLYALPESNLGRRTLDGPPVPDGIAQAYIDTVKAMLSHPWNTNAQGEKCAHVLTLSSDAHAAWKRFAHSIEAGMGPGGQFEHLTDWAGKLPGAVARIAATFHVVRHAHGQPWQSPVGIEDMAAAVRLGETLGQHALLAFDSMGGDVAMENARKILAWIAREGLQEFTRREAHKAHQSRFQRAEEMAGPLEVLIERGYIRPCPRTTGAGGRPSMRYEVSPAIFRGGVNG
ncbi:MAG TPA: DUF3987 domain-containing protein [Candidatus Hydrogenedentes bacterium]|nr:DUF3987 domain-containing protein [Candidatus Hydrogenedentota bacterium]